MRAGLTGIMMGISIAVALRNGKRPSLPLVFLSLFSELITILILALS